jgi:hypothetical protein
VEGDVDAGLLGDCGIEVVSRSTTGIFIETNRTALSSARRPVAERISPVMPS